MKGSNGDDRGAMLTRLPDCVSQATALVNKSRLPTSPIYEFRTKPLFPKITAAPFGAGEVAPPAFGPAAAAAAGVPAFAAGAAGAGEAEETAGEGVTCTASVMGPFRSPGSNRTFLLSKFVFA